MLSVLIKSVVHSTIYCNLLIHSLLIESVLPVFFLLGKIPLLFGKYFPFLLHLNLLPDMQYQFPFSLLLYFYC